MKFFDLNHPDSVPLYHHTSEKHNNDVKYAWYDVIPYKIYLWKHHAAVLLEDMRNSQRNYSINLRVFFQSFQFKIFIDYHFVG